MSFPNDAFLNNLNVKNFRRVLTHLVIQRVYRVVLQVVCTIPTGGNNEPGPVVEVIVLYSKGFLCGEQGGNVSMWERVEEAEIKESFKRVKSFKVDSSKGRICCMAISPNEDMLVCALDNNILITIPFQNEFLFKENEVPKDILVQVRLRECKNVNLARHLNSVVVRSHTLVFVQPFHSEKITGMDACLRKPLAVTCSIDKSVRLWNYVEKRCELCKYFPEEAYSISMHPSGTAVFIVHITISNSY